MIIRLCPFFMAEVEILQQSLAQILDWWMILA